MKLVFCWNGNTVAGTENCNTVAGTENNQNKSFQINDTNLYVPVVTLSTQGNIKVLKQL